jgi:flagellar biosynthesis protein FlhF
VENYSCLNFRHVLATKLDETVCYGSLLSMLYRHQLPLSFITNGQEVPEDFEIANLERLVIQALK